MPQHPGKLEMEEAALVPSSELTSLFLYQEQKYLLLLLENRQSRSVHGPLCFWALWVPCGHDDPPACPLRAAGWGWVLELAGVVTAPGLSW